MIEVSDLRMWGGAAETSDDSAELLFSPKMFVMDFVTKNAMSR